MMSSPFMEEVPLSDCLERVDPALAALRQAAFGSRDALPFTFGNAALRLRFIDAAAEARFTPALALLLRVGQAQGWLLLEAYDMVGEEWAGVFERLDPMLVRALLIDQASALFEQMAAASGEAVQLLDVQVSQTFVTEVTMQALRIENETTGVGVRAALRSDDPDFFMRLAKALATCASRPGAMPAAACLPLRLLLGRIWLQRDEVTQTHGGDVLLLPLETGALPTLRARCEGYRGARLPLAAWLEGGTGRIKLIEGEMMTNEANEMQPALDDISVPITAVIGELELPLQAVGTLQAGYVFELPTTIEQATVHLYTGSRRIGCGRLVTIGERLGVRLVEWGGAGHVDPA